uniref:Anaphase-promoting complex subunit 4 WD40 domain-containing protein n=1 Tax=Phytophthora ramorum TaxID=164328 RepID=H3GKZ6_PHYRM
MFQSAVIRDEYEFTGHNSAVGAVCYNRHQDSFVSVDETCLRLWRAQPGGQLRQVNLPARTSRFIQAITYMDTRQLFVASALDGALRLYDPSLNELAAIFTGRGTVLGIVFDVLHNRLLTGGVDGCAAWQVKPRPSGMPEGALNAHYEFTALPKFFHGTAVRNSRRNKPHANQQTKPSRSPVERVGWVESLQLGSESTRLYAQTRHWIDVFNTADGVHLERWDDLFPAEHGTLTAFVVQERAKHLVCGTSSGVIVVLSYHPISIVHLFKDHTQAITSLAEHATSRLMISSSLDGSVRLWDLEARRQAHRLNVGHAVHGLQLLPPVSLSGSASRATDVELAGRFCCQLRNTVKIYDIQSILKEHQPCLVPVSILQRVVFPVHGEKLTNDASPSRKHIQDDPTEENEEDNSDFDDEDEGASGNTQQLVVVACMDKTLRVFAGRTPNEAPSFTWIPDEQALDLVAFALHPVSQHLFLLLSSQKLLVVNAAPRRSNHAPIDDGSAAGIGGNNADSDNHGGAEATTGSIERVIDLNPSAAVQKAAEPGGILPKGNNGDAFSIGEASTSSAATARGNGAALRCIFQSEWEWVACGSDFGQLLFWHTGLRGGREATLTLDAHDAPIVDISASASSPLLPQFGLRHVLDLGQSPSVFALSPLSEIILSGYDDGRVVLHTVGYKAASVEAFAGGDDHSMTVSAGDFLDEKFLVLTASVDAIVKIWDQQRVLLRQVTLATAVTSLCFLNADGDLLAGLSRGTFLISRRDVLPEKLPKPAPRRRIHVAFQDTKAEVVDQAERAAGVPTAVKPPPSGQQLDDAAPSNAASPPQKAISAPSRPPDPDVSAKQLLVHVIQRPIEAANHLRPPVLRTLSSSGRLPSSRLGSFTNNNSSEGQIAPSTDRTKLSDQSTDHQEEDWRDKILPLSPYQKLMRAPQRGSSYRRKRSQTPLVLQALGPIPRAAFSKHRASRENNDSPVDERQHSVDARPTLGLGVGSAEAPLLYCKHQAPVPPKDKTPRKLWNAIGGEDRRLIVLQRSHLPPC